MSMTYQKAVKSIEAERTGIGERKPVELVDVRNQLAERGYVLRKNLITQQIEADAVSTSGRKLGLEDIVTEFLSDMRINYYGVTADILKRFLVSIAMDNQYNPVLEYLDTIKWDRKDHLGEFYVLLGLDDDFEKVLVKKWLYQTMALLYNDEDEPFGAEGVLVLNGGQGWGKTNIFARLALQEKWFGRGRYIEKHDKDTERRVITNWITELGEVDRTLSNSDSGLKAFITENEDRYRLPYAAMDTVAPRRTSVAGTVNCDRFLVDDTGNRRWWVIKMKAPILYDDIQNFPAEQMWAQIHADVDGMTQKERSACFRLTRQERAKLEDSNHDFVEKVKAQQEIEDLLFEIMDSGQYVTRRMSSTEFKKSNESLHAYSATTIGKALKAAGFEEHRSKSGRYYEIPVYSEDHEEQPF